MVSENFSLFQCITVLGYAGYLQKLTVTLLLGQLFSKVINEISFIPCNNSSLPSSVLQLISVSNSVYLGVKNQARCINCTQCVLAIRRSRKDRQSHGNDRFWGLKKEKYRWVQIIKSNFCPCITESGKRNKFFSSQADTQQVNTSCCVNLMVLGAKAIPSSPR